MSARGHIPMWLHLLYSWVSLGWFFFMFLWGIRLLADFLHFGWIRKSIFESSTTKDDISHVLDPSCVQTSITAVMMPTGWFRWLMTASWNSTWHCIMEIRNHQLRACFTVYLEQMRGGGFLSISVKSCTDIVYRWIHLDIRSKSFSLEFPFIFEGERLNQNFCKKSIKTRMKGQWYCVRFRLSAVGELCQILVARIDDLNSILVWNCTLILCVLFKTTKKKFIPDNSRFLCTMCKSTPYLPK